MPELPEVEVIKEELREKIVGKSIVDIEINKPGIIKEPGPRSFKKGLKGQKIKSVERKAKVLIIELEEGNFLIVHLRIAGWLLCGRKDKRARIAFKLSDGSFLNYMDQRVLGQMRLVKDFRDLKFIKELGPEPFDINATQFREILKKRKTNIKVLLMDQKVISGIGNIYAQEALFLAKINPRRSANTLTGIESNLLYKKIASILREAIKHKGSSVDTYRDLSGDKGGMEKRLKVYGRKNKPCFVCKKPLKKIPLGGRGTCFCPHCQQ